jgi:hypothetical protein
MFEAIDDALMQFNRNFSRQSGTVSGDRGASKGKVHLPITSFCIFSGQPSIGR